MAETVTRKTLVWVIGGLGAVLILGMVALKVWFASMVFLAPEEPVVAAADEPLDAREQIARDMVTSTETGTPVMPDQTAALNPSDYSVELARFIPIEPGMDQFLAKDELLLYYNNSPDSGAKVSSSERFVDGATLFVIRRTGLADDAIAAEETYALFDAGVLAAYGSRIQCRRGATPNQWTTELCP